jgi:hypothetical protein
MSRWALHVWLLLVLAALFSSCSEKLIVPSVHIISPDSLQATVGDTLRFLGVYTGDPEDVARHNWDFNSDGIFELILPVPSGWGDSIRVRAIYGQPGLFVATLQITTVENRLYRSTTQVRITDEIPLLSVDIPSPVPCDSIFDIWGRASDDRGEVAFWDLDGDGISDVDTLFKVGGAIADTVELTSSLVFSEPGSYPVSFGARDDDGHVERLFFDIEVGHPPEWVLAAPRLSEARADHAGIVHNGEIYIFGGRDEETTLGSVEIFRPPTTRPRLGAPMPTPRWGAQAAVVDDSVFVVGGVKADGTVFQGVEIYDLVTQTWADTTGNSLIRMPIPMRGFSLLEIGDNAARGDSLLLFGGWTGGAPLEGGAPNDTSMVYNMRQGSFTLETHFSSMQLTRAWTGAATVWDEGSLLRGKLFAIGGTSDGTFSSGRVESYNPAADFWSTGVPLNTPRIAPGVLYHDGKLYAFGGAESLYGATSAVEVFNFESNRWTAAPPMPLPRRGPLVLAVDDWIYVIGGGTEDSTPSSTEGSDDIQILLPWRCAR